MPPPRRRRWAPSLPLAAAASLRRVRAPVRAVAALLTALYGLRAWRAERAFRTAGGVTVSVETNHFFGRGYQRVVTPCSVPCRFARGARGADARWYHLCGRRSLNAWADPDDFAAAQEWVAPVRETPGQALILMSMESSANYPCLRDDAYTRHFDIISTYRLDSHVPQIYLSPAHVAAFGDPAARAGPKADAVLYVQSVCGAATGRDDVARRLIELSAGRAWRLESRGACVANAPPLPRGADKVAASRRYKFALTFENSEDAWYVSEKIWDALAGGALPIYFGSREIAQLLPHPLAALDYRAIGSPEALAGVLDALVANASAYEEHHAWRALPLERLGAGYQTLVALARGPHTQCRMCELVAARRRANATA